MFTGVYEFWWGRDSRLAQQICLCNFNQKSLSGTSPVSFFLNFDNLQFTNIFVDSS